MMEPQGLDTVSTILSEPLHDGNRGLSYPTHEDCQGLLSRDE